MRLIEVSSLDDPRLSEFREVKDRQLLPAYTWAADKRDDPDAPFGRFMAEGEVVLPHLVASACRVMGVLLTPARLATARLLLDQLPADTPCYLAPQRLFDSIIGFNLHRGLLAIAARPAPVSAAAIIAACTPAHPLLILEDLSNHDNIGGLFRSAAALGASGVLLSPRCADPLYRKALRVSVGCVLRVPWAYAHDWPPPVADLAAAGITTIALATDGADALASVAPQLRRSRVALFLGAEGPGLTPATLAAVARRVRIPMARGVDSLNVVVAGSIALAALANPGTPDPNITLPEFGNSGDPSLV